ncbi:S8 family serine peptidase [Sinanaerobacter sp. ZZT-01]|uniref:S8 family serine peptidase n=1 Tax=Sinanaerobacter sp. ZZT-01 TaxID=3111540 RepID=UPI002D79AE2B|nr:S8 family serine peptidase [Sinanaerobacter sp. ZZT-01]WRR93079.1 S8 family serine peptidase [Sinanaerobacter sp. ZZT-01]
MKLRKRRLKRISASMLAFMLAFMFVLPFGNAAFAYEEGQINSVSLGEKIDENVVQKFTDETYVNYIIKLKEQGDLQTASEKAAGISLFAKDTPQKAKIRIHNYVLNELIDTAEETQDSLLTYIERQKEIGTIRSYESFYIVNAISVCSTEEVMQEIAKRTDVEKVVQDQTYTLNYIIPEEADISMQALEDSMGIPWNLSNINAEQAWDEGYTGNGIVVANMDSGVDYTHPALSESWRGNDSDLTEYSWFDSVNQTSVPTDGDGHGTHVMGTMVGELENGTNKIGVAPDAKWIAARVFDDEGETTSSTIMRAGEWLIAPTDEAGKPHAEMAPDVINNSWGGDTNDEFFRDVVQAWRKAGIVPVFSAGNTSYSNLGGAGSVTSPACYPEAIAVGALDRSNKIAYFSLLGPSSYGEIKPEVSAPGVNIRSSLPGGKYGLLNGTSMASPHVAGVAALVLNANPSLSVEQVETILQETATPLTDEKYVNSPNNAYGRGQINAYRAVKMAEPSGAGIGTVSGTTTVRGEDSAIPIVSHVPVKNLYNVYDTTIEAQVSDNIGVDSVDFFIRKSGTETEYSKLEMKLSAGNKKDGTYQVMIPVTMMDLNGVEYYISASDTEGNTAKTDVYPVVVSSGVKVGYLQDFEDNIDGFEFGGTTPMWEWGVPTTGVESAASGEKVVATNLDGSYEGLVDSIMVMPVIDLSDRDGAALRFNHWYDLGDFYGVFNDTAEVWIGELPSGSTDPSDIDFNLARIYKSHNDKWDFEYIDLTPYKGKKIVVMFGLRYGSFSDQSELGWYIDDLQVVEPSEEIPATPYQYLNFKLKDRTTALITFNKIDDARISSYAMYRSTSQAGPYELISTVDVSEIAYTTVTLKDVPLPQAGTYYYYAVSRIGENESGPTQVFSHTFTEGETIIKYDFEEDDQGWVSEAESEDDASFTRGTIDFSEYKNHNMPKESTSLGKNPDSPNVWGTELNEYRKVDKKYTLESPAIDLSSQTSARLYYQNWFNSFGRKGYDDYGYGPYKDDIGYVYYSADNGENWEQIFIFNEKSMKNSRVRENWYLDSQDIPKKYLTENFKIRFVLETGDEDSGPGCGGWYIDDIEITGGAPDIGGSTKTSNELTSFDLSDVVANTNGEFVKTEEGIGGGHLPISANITVKESGVGIKSEIGSGAYSFNHPAGNYTLVFEANGYKEQEIPVTISKDENVIVNVEFNTLEESTLILTVKNLAGNKIANAKVTAVGASGIFRGVTDEFGATRIDGLYEGNYAVKVTAPGYAPIERTIEIVEGEQADLGTLTLSSLSEGEKYELFYDSGTVTTKSGFKSDGGVYGVKMTPSKMVKIDAIKMFFTDGDAENTEQNPVGKKFMYTIYGDSGTDGYAGEILAGPFTAEVTAADDWTEISLAEPLIVDESFYVAYTQIGDKTAAPRIGIDGTSPNSKNSYLLSGGAWREPSVSGAIMIRSVVTAVETTTYNGIIISPETLVLKEGQSASLIVKLYEESNRSIDVTSGAGFKTSNAAVATVSESGAVTAVSAGTAKITATFTNPVDGTEYHADSNITVRKVSEGGSNSSGSSGRSGRSTPTSDTSSRATINGKTSDIVKVENNVATVGLTQNNVAQYIQNGMMEIKAIQAEKVEVSLPLSKLAGQTGLITQTKSNKAELSRAFLSELKEKYGEDLTVTINKDQVYFEKNGKNVAVESMKNPIKLTLDGISSNSLIADENGNVLTFSKQVGKAVTLFSYGSGKFKVISGGKTFADISEHWGKDNISFVADRGIFGGVGADSFDPNGGMTRGMFAMILANMEKADIKGYNSTAFADVSTDAWYAQAIAWAAEKGLVDGTGDGNFAPEKKITREESAVLLDRYIKYKSFEFDKTKNNGFSDYSQISSWAVESVNNMQSYRIIHGKTDGDFDPAGNVTRAEVATIVKNFVDVALN